MVATPFLLGRRPIALTFKIRVFRSKKLDIFGSKLAIQIEARYLRIEARHLRIEARYLRVEDRSTCRAVVGRAARYELPRHLRRSVLGRPPALRRSEPDRQCRESGFASLQALFGDAHRAIACARFEHHRSRASRAPLNGANSSPGSISSAFAIRMMFTSATFRSARSICPM